MSMRDILRRHWGKILLLGLLASVIAAAPFLALHKPGATTSTLHHCPMHPSYTSDRPGDCPICGMRLVPVPVASAATPATQSSALPLYVCPMHPEVQQHEPGKCPKCGMDLVKHEGASSLYVCPMHPEVQQHEPGKCPKCGMDLVKQETSGHGAAGGIEGQAAIHATPDQLALAGVRTAEAVSGALTNRVRAVGNVVPDETRVRQVTTKVAGWVERLYVNNVGQQVRAGEPLLDLFSPELLASQEEYLRARKTAEQFERSALPEVRQGGRDLAEAAKKRLELFDVPADFLAEIEKTGVARRTITLRAPFSGYVTGKAVLEGQRIDAGMPLLTLTDLSRVWVVAQLYEAEARAARPGRPADVSLQHDAATRLNGRVSLVYPTVDMQSRTIQVRFEFANPRLTLKPGMYVNVELDNDRATGVVVPDSALMDTGARQIVFVRTAAGTFEPREVKVALRADGKIVIAQGLQAGELVAVSANFLLDSESRLRAAIGAPATGHEGHK